jgi:hypothetical protein
VIEVSYVPPSCDPQVRELGDNVCKLVGFAALELDAFVRRCSGRTGQRVGWYYAGGWMFVVMIGDLAPVRLELELWIDEVVRTGRRPLGWSWPN